ncbi:MAG: methyltransferase domain-containing protein [Thermoleophilia bacterium]|nr:methyltransferase domain-containing protein [Thermoleophilia bacterium]
MHLPHSVAPTRPSWPHIDAGGNVTTSKIEQAERDAVRSVWRLGDYHRFARTLIWDVGPVLVRAAGIGPGVRVLDVAAGSGNVALRAAEAGAEVVACDITPEHFEAGRREAARRGVELEWVEADAQHLPFHDASFDVVTSSFGVMWAPDQRRAAAELVRVARPGGTICVAAFTPDGGLGDFLAVFAPFMPASDAPSPAVWGDRDGVRGLLGHRVSGVRDELRSYVERVPGGPEGFCDFYRQTFGPVIAIYRGLEGDDSRRAQLDEAFLEFVVARNAGAPGGDAEVAFEYLITVAEVGEGLGG